MAGEGARAFSRDMSEWAQELDEAIDELPGQIDEAASEAADELRDDMKDRAPKSSGTLRDAIKSDPVMRRKREASYVVGPIHEEADYAEYVEYGTGEKGEPGHASGSSYYITPDGLSPQEVLAAQKAGDFEALKEMAATHGALAWDGSDHPVLIVEHPGVESQAFFRPAVSDAIKKKTLIRKLNEKTGTIFGALSK